MTQVLSPCELDASYAAVLRSRKSDFIHDGPDMATVTQHGAARVPTVGWPRWPTGLAAAEPVIETFLAAATSVTATSDNEPFVTAWTPLAQWMNTAVRNALGDVNVQVSGDAYITASITPTNTLEGLAHLDDGIFVPDDSVSMVAIIGELAGPRVAMAAVEHTPIRPMAALSFDQALLDAFANDAIDHCAADADELVVFPQFGQIHAGPAAHHVADLAPTRQLLVMRAAIILDDL